MRVPASTRHQVPAVILAKVGRASKVADRPRLHGGELHQGGRFSKPGT
jgi:hypothetical protein